MSVNTSKIAASSYIVGLSQVGPTQSTSLAVGGVVLGGNGNISYSVNLTAPKNKCIALPRLKFSGLTSVTPADVGNVWYPIEGSFSLIVRGAGVSDFFWLECYFSRNGTTYTCNFEIANNSASANVTVPAFTVLVNADFYDYPF